MTTLPKSLVIFCFNLCASMYIGIGVYGLLLSMGPKMGNPISLGQAAAFGVATLLLIEGICFFGQVWDKIVATEAAVRKTAPGK